MSAEKIDESRTLLPWFKTFVDDMTVLEYFDDAVVGKAYKLAIQYCTGKEVNIENQEDMVAVVYSLLRKGIDRSEKDYRKKSQAGKKGSEARWKGKPDEEKISPEERRQQFSVVEM